MKLNKPFSMRVIKRNGHSEVVSFNKVLNRIRKASKELTIHPDALAQQILSQIHDGVKTSDLDNLTAQLAASLSTVHPDYGHLASRISISNHHKNTSSSFSDVVKTLSDQTMPKTGEKTSLLHSDLLDIVKLHGDEIDKYINYDRDYLLDYFGFKTLEKSYLIRDTSQKCIERPQHLWMRVSLALWGKQSLQKAFKTYDLLSQKVFTHATPTLYNAGTPRQQLSSCFLLCMADDSISGIYKTLSDCAMISKYSGGIGLHIHNVRASGSLIKGTNGKSNGIVPMLRVFNNTARYVDQGGGKRNGSFAMYLEPWHADVEEFLKMRLNTGAEEERARDLFYALWVPDLFMKRVEADGDWTLFCPNEAPGLADVYGEKFDELYERYEKEGRGRKSVKAQKLWFQILDSQMETGTPYLLYKDPANQKSNQQNLGTIKSSNLCVAPETLILTDKGTFPISTIVNKDVNVWNGDEWSRTTIIKTGENQKLIQVNFSNGTSICCTPYHKFLLSDNCDIKKSIRIEAELLKPGMKLKKFQLPIITDGTHFKHPYTHGFFCGDGTYSTTGIPICTLYGDKKKLVPYLDIHSMSGVEDSFGRLNTTLIYDLDDKFTVPINYSLVSKLRWLEGLCDADGSVSRNGTNESIQIASINNKFLQDIRIMLTTIGVQSKITILNEEDLRYMPDGKGDYQYYPCKQSWRLLISSSGTYDLIRLGFNPKRLKIVFRKPQRNSEHFIKVLSVSNINRFDDTYCFTEPINNAGVFNGILTGNCTEIIEYSSPEETAVCNLASLALPAFVLLKENRYDFVALRAATRVAIENLNRVIDINFYPTPETERSNMRHRPVGLGVQGLADVFAMLKMSWESDEAAKLNQLIFEHMYYAALEMSAEIALVEGPYSTFQGSPISNGIIQPDMWGVKPITESDGSLDWAGLRIKASKGIRNSLLLAPMPTASTSQILGFNECFEPFTTNIYTRRTLAGEFIVLNKYLLKELIDLGIWSENLKQEIVARNGSVRGIAAIPEEIQLRYITSWEMKQRTLIDMAAARGAFICQSQSLNLFVSDPVYDKLTSMHFYAWKKGLKTGCYYLRTKTGVTAQKFTIDPRLHSAIYGSGVKVEADVEESMRDDLSSDSDSDSDSESKNKNKNKVDDLVKKAAERMTRMALIEKLANDYEEEVAAIRMAKERGEEVCESCSG